MFFSANFLGLDMGDSRILDWVWVVLEDFSPIIEFKKLYRVWGGGFGRFPSGFGAVSDGFHGASEGDLSEWKAGVILKFGIP
ncbi:hypothetical protein TIFTF001_020534 [Ficus carica]|uniref:Uncharacterized protein n=1 Tax=Ficus carica TaxID=3494 RepID=A0AA88AFX4_FICCA|nr:hypothetical protein TIFTF001_020534 [Ficus carica]